MLHPDAGRRLLSLSLSAATRAADSGGGWGVRGFEGISSLSSALSLLAVVMLCRKGGKGSVVRPGKEGDSAGAAA